MDSFYQFMTDFYSWTGIDLRLYKRPQMERRLNSLREKHGCKEFGEWLIELKSNPSLLHQFLDKMTINVSEFFRNIDRWESLCQLLKPNVRSKQTLKAWSAACSTGEEPYTLAILMEQIIGQPYHILATDIDENVLNQARLGKYRAHQVKTMPKYATQYLHQQDQEWQISSQLKQHITFSQHNLLSDQYPQSLDLIICRNVLIYFTDEAKQQVIREFSNALKIGGLLFVGSTEQFLRTDMHGMVPMAPFIYCREQ